MLKPESHKKQELRIRAGEYIYDKISVKIPIIFSRDMNQMVEKCLGSQCWRILEKKFQNPDPGADDLQNLIDSLLSTDTVHLWENFYNDPFSSFCVKLLTENEKDQRNSG